MGLGLGARSASALELPGRPTSPVNDYANALRPDERARLEAELRGWEQGATQQIVVALFPSLDGESLEDFSMRLAEAWKIGGKKNNDGVLLTLFLADHKMRIEVGYGLEDKLTDALSARIERDVMAPRLGQGHVADALEAAVASIHDLIGGGTGNLPPPQSRSGQGGSARTIFFLLFLLFVVVLPILRRQDRLPWWLLFFFGGGGGGGGWSSGGGGWSGGGGGGGGWSGGGGGSFGGGGASGSW